MSSAEALQDVNWRTEEAAELREDTLKVFTTLSKELLRDVQPPDLIISGTDISDIVRRKDPYWNADSYTPPSVTLEHWSTDGEQVVCIAKDERVPSGLKWRLANQVTGAYAWWPGASEKRTQRIAQVAGASSILRVAVFNTADVGEPEGDGFFRELRDTVANWPLEYGFAQNLTVDPGEVVGHKSWKYCR
jgi:hypothetical protein